MKERPILFRPEMVRAILADRKTQTRRIYKGYSTINLVRMDDGIDICVSDAVCPYGKIGDNLWVRESCWIDGVTNHVHYCATDFQNAPKKTPSIFMPRWASRITLKIINIKIEQLQDISDIDAIAEGVYVSPMERPTEAYENLWDDINGPESWDTNPFVWAITFERIKNA